VKDFNLHVIKKHIWPTPDGRRGRLSFHGQVENQRCEIKSLTTRTVCVQVNVHFLLSIVKVCIRSKNNVRKTPHGGVIRHSALFCTHTHLLLWVCNTAVCSWTTLHCHSRLVYITRPPRWWIQGPESERGAARRDTTPLFFKQGRCIIVCDAAPRPTNKHTKTKTHARTRTLREASDRHTHTHAHTHTHSCRHPTYSCAYRELTDATSEWLTFHSHW